MDLAKDLLHVSYDPKKLTPEEMLEVVRKQGFQGTFVPNPPPIPAEGN